MQPTVRMTECVGLIQSVQKRAPSDGQRAHQGLVSQLEEDSMRSRMMRIGALLSALSTLVALAMAGGAGVRGW